MKIEPLRERQGFSHNNILENIPRSNVGASRNK